MAPQANPSLSFLGAGGGLFFWFCFGLGLGGFFVG